jgi:glycosyltransferase involved in cell wall biosynthesis
MAARGQEHPAREWAHSQARRLYPIEKALAGGKPLDDYQFLVFGGKAAVVQVDRGRFAKGPVRNFYASDWEPIPVAQAAPTGDPTGPPDTDLYCARPGLVRRGHPDFPVFRWWRQTDSPPRDRRMARREVAPADAHQRPGPRQRAPASGGDDGGTVTRVLSIGPTGGQPGGMASVVAELSAQNRLSAAPVRLRVLDSGGLGPWRRRLIRFAFCLLAVLMSRADVAHLHVASRGSTWRKAVIAEACSVRRLRYGIHLHGATYEDFLRTVSGSRRCVVERFFQRAAYVVVLGEFWARLVTEQLSVPASRVHVIHNGVALGVPPTVPWPSGRPKRVLFLGRIGVTKGVPELLRAFEKLDDVPDARLVLAGPETDPAVLQLVHEAVRARPDRVEYQGSLPRRQSQELMRQAYVFALPSRAEGLPMTLIEAMAMGVPCVTTPVGAIEELVTHGKNGYIVEPGDTRALTDHVRHLLSSEALRDAMAAAAYETWTRDFDAARMYERLRELWSETAG